MKQTLTEILKRTKILETAEEIPNFYCRDLLGYCIYEMTGTMVKNCYDCDMLKNNKQMEILRK